MKLNSANLEAFYAVSRILNFSNAAKELCITQSALSQRILNLENSLETKLFIREPANIRLTESGQDLLRFCQIQICLEEEMLAKLASSQNKHELSGIIRIGGYSSIMRSLIVPKLDFIFAKHPEVKLELFVAEIHELPKMLKTGEIDFMLLDHHCEERNLLESITIGQEENVMVQVADLASKRDHIFLDHDPNDQTTIRFLEKNGKKNPKIMRLYLDDIYGILDAVKLGWGKAIVPKHLIESKKIQIVAEYKSMKNPIVLHYYKRPYYSELQKKIIATLTPA